MLFEEHAAFVNLYGFMGKLKLKTWQLQELLYCKNIDEEYIMKSAGNKNIIAY